MLHKLSQNVFHCYSFILFFFILLLVIIVLYFSFAVARAIQGSTIKIASDPDVPYVLSPRDTTLVTKSLVFEGSGKANTKVIANNVFSSQDNVGVFCIVNHH